MAGHEFQVLVFPRVNSILYLLIQKVRLNEKRSYLSAHDYHTPYVHSHDGNQPSPYLVELF